MAYYKGKINYTSDLHYQAFIKKIAISYSYIISEDEIELIDSGYLIDTNLYKLFINSIYESSLIKEYKVPEKLVFCFNKVFSSDILNCYSEIISFKSYDIIYEIVKDINGDLYAKEIHTGLLFPILSKNNYFIDYQIFNKIVDDSSYSRDRIFYLKGIPTISFNSLYKCNIFITGNKVADQNEIDEYQHRFSKGFRKARKKQEYLNYIRSIYNKNVFKEDFKLEDVKKKKEVIHKIQSIETSLMEDIDYSLMNLKEINQELYLEYKTKYNYLLNNNLTKESLALLLGEIEFSLVFGKRNIKDILEFLNNLKKEYLENFLNKSEKKTEFDLEKLDKINDLFLSIKDKYSFKDQREVLRNLAFLYFFEVYENIGFISIEDLSNSYFSKHLKSILMWIKLLSDENIIECNYLISLREELNVEVVFDLINNIEFKSFEKGKVKELINKL